MTVQAGYQVFGPTIWHRLGFHARYVPPWDDDGHYLVTEVTIQFDWLDRLRLLVTGRVVLMTRSRTEVPAGKVESRSAVGVVGPGW